MFKNSKPHSGVGGLKVFVNSGNSSKLLWFGILKLLVNITLEW